MNVKDAIRRHTALLSIVILAFACGQANSRSPLQLQLPPPLQPQLQPHQKNQKKSLTATGPRQRVGHQQAQRPRQLPTRSPRRQRKLCPGIIPLTARAAMARVAMAALVSAGNRCKSLKTPFARGEAACHRSPSHSIRMQVLTTTIMS